MIRFSLFSLFLFASLFSIAQSFDGFALYNAQGSSTTYLIDENQQIAHTWNMNTECNYTVQLKNNGNLVRGTKYNNNVLNGAASAGRVQEIAPNGTIVWDYVYSSSDYLSHHDLTLIGDNVLITAWEVKSASELDSLGYNNATSEKWPTHFIELEWNASIQDVEIVWEWHIWDHLCQDVDPNKPNYVSNISNHPERIDINMIQGGGGPGGGGPGGGGGDWFHVNGVDYNEELDQIAFSSRFASEIYIIDHSTTTAEAATNSGGNSGMGGDILYRWGNPSNYGIPGQQVIPSAVHDVRWITNDGRPNAGYLQIFNNSGISSNQSTVDGIKTPIDSTTGYTYLRVPGQAFEPSSYTTRYVCAYSSSGQSASDRMSNGNIYVNASGGQNGAGVMYEVDSTGALIWGPHAAIGSNNGSQKGFRYECDYPGILALEPYMNTSTTSCFNTSDIDNIYADLFLIYPNPTNNNVIIESELLIHNNVTLNVRNLLGELVHEEEITNKQSNFVFDFENFNTGLYFFSFNTSKQLLHNEIISYTK